MCPLNILSAANHVVNDDGSRIKWVRQKASCPQGWSDGNRKKIETRNVLLTSPVTKTCCIHERVDVWKSSANLPVCLRRGWKVGCCCWIWGGGGGGGWYEAPCRQRHVRMYLIVRMMSRVLPRLARYPLPVACLFFVEQVVDFVFPSVHVPPLISLRLF